MKDRKLTPAEIVEQEEFSSLFESARATIQSATKDEDQLDTGVRRFYLIKGASYFWNEKTNTFGVDFSREHGRLMGETNYSFSLEDGTVSITGYAGYSFGPESLPGLIYAPLDRNMGEFEDVRHAPIEVDLQKLRELADFIDNPIKNKHLIKELAKLPGDEVFEK